MRNWLTADSQLATNLDPSDIVNQNQFVDQVIPYTFVGNITASPNLLGQSAAGEYYGHDSSDYSWDLPGEDDYEIRYGCDVARSDSDTADNEGDSVSNKLAPWATKFSYYFVVSNCFVGNFKTNFAKFA